MRAAADHQVDAFGFAGVVVVEQQLGFFGEHGFAVLVIAILGATHGADDLFRRDAVGLLGINAHKILAAAGDDVSLVAVGAEISQHFLHRLVGQFVVRLVPARVFGFGQPLLHFGLKLLGRNAGGAWRRAIFSRSFIVEFRDGRAVAGAVPARC